MADLVVNLAETCIVLHVATVQSFDVEASGMPGSSNRSERIATRIAPLEPGTEWTRLDIQLTGWFLIHPEPDDETLPAIDVASPAATPAG